jgi:hypothetical protein
VDAWPSWGNLQKVTQRGRIHIQGQDWKSQKLTNYGYQISDHNQPLFSGRDSLLHDINRDFQEEQSLSFFVNFVKFDSSEEKSFRSIQNHSPRARVRRKVKSMDFFDSIRSSEVMR